MKIRTLLLSGVAALALGSGPALATDTFYVGEQVSATGGISCNGPYIWPRAAADDSSNGLGCEANLTAGEVIAAGTDSGPKKLGPMYEVQFSDNLTGWITPDFLTQTVVGAPYVQLGVNALGTQEGYIPTAGSADLTWTSTNATSCTGSGGSLAGAPFSTGGATSGTTAALSPAYSSTYTVTCTNASGSNSASASIIVNSAPTSHAWVASSPVTWNVTGGWVSDQNFSTVMAPASTPLAVHGPNNYWDFQAISNLGSVYFDHDMNKSPIASPVDVMLAGFFGNFDTFTTGLSNLWVGQKTLVHGSAGGPQGTWQLNQLATGAGDESRAFGSHTDTGTGVEMAFAGGDAYGIFSGAFNQTPNVNAIQWGASAEAQSAQLVAAATYPAFNNSGRIMSFADCGGNLYASLFNTIIIRTDGVSPSWSLYAQVPSSVWSTLPSGSSGFRGLTCVALPNGAGNELLTSLEGPGDIYAIPLGLSAPYTLTASKIELNMSKFLSTQLGTYIPSSVDAYNNMLTYPNTGTAHRPDIMFGTGMMFDSPANSCFVNNILASYGDAAGNWCKHGGLIVRHPNGVYDYENIAPFAGNWELSTRSLAVGLFTNGQNERVFSGGYDAHAQPSQNTDWIYKAPN
jgi:hypothetical protein